MKIDWLGFLCSQACSGAGTPSRTCSDGCPGGTLWDPGSVQCWLGVEHGPGRGLGIGHSGLVVGGARQVWLGKGLGRDCGVEAPHLVDSGVQNWGIGIPPHCTWVLGVALLVRAVEGG